jgi:uncharacterized delta-60 repeat protein
MKPILSAAVIFYIAFLFPSTAHAQILDSSFGVNGRQAIDAGYDDEFSISYGALQSDGSIVVSGVLDDENNYTPQTLVWHVLTNGMIDTSFGTNGVLFAGHVFGGQILLQSDGKIVGEGNQTDAECCGDGRFYLFRSKVNGQFDSSFGINGQVLNYDFGRIESIALRTDGKILVGGIITDTQCFVQFLPNGNIDSSFGINGIINETTPYQINTWALKILPDNKILAAHTFNVNDTGIYSCLIRYNANGIIDSTFGNNGIAFNKVSLVYREVVNLDILADSSIILLTNDSLVNLTLIKFKQNGSLDTSFGNEGVVHTNTRTYYTNSIAEQPDGKLFINATDTAFALMRLLPNGMLDSSFGLNGIIKTDFLNFFGGTYGTVTIPLLQKDSKILAIGAGYENSGDYAAVLARFTYQISLPVNFISFTATKQSNSVLLNWQTENEINNHYFSVEKSSDGNNFSTIGKVNSLGNSAKKQQYVFTDASPFNGENYYRLKQVDEDGKFTYSNITRVDFIVPETFKLYPNPAKAIIRIDGFDPSSLSSISVIDNSGKTILQTKVSGISYQINVRNLSAGNYYLQIFSGNKKITTLKFVKE